MDEHDKGYVKIAEELARHKEREKVVAWMRKSADQIIGNILTGSYDAKQCEYAAQAIEMAATEIESGEHLK